MQSEIEESILDRLAPPSLVNDCSLLSGLSLKKSSNVYNNMAAATGYLDTDAVETNLSKFWLQSCQRCPLDDDEPIDSDAASMHA